MASRRRNPSCLALILHVLLTCITGGFWLIVLAIWYMLKKK